MDIKKTLTKNPKTKPSQENLGFGKYFTDHMFIMDYSDEKGWYEPRIVPYAPMEMDPATCVFHYGQAVFEGLKCFRAHDGRVIAFRPQENFKRLNNSDERMCIPAIDEEFALSALKELILTDLDWLPSLPETSLYARPFVFGTDIMLGVHPSHTYRFVMILSPSGAYFGDNGFNAVKILIEDQHVRAVRGGIGFTKAAANYAISLKAQHTAEQNGYSQVLWLDGVERKYIEEVGAMNVFFKIGDTVITPSLEGSILPGITRDSIIKILKSWNMKVEERKLSLEELVQAGENGQLVEAFGAGTAAGVAPIGGLHVGDNDITVGNGKSGELSKKLYDELNAIRYGDTDPFGWSFEIKA